MSASEVIRNYMKENGIKQSFVAERAGIPAELFRRSMDGKRKMPADEFLAVCGVLSLQLEDFSGTTSA